MGGGGGGGGGKKGEAGYSFVTNLIAVEDAILHLCLVQTEGVCHDLDNVVVPFI